MVSNTGVWTAETDYRSFSAGKMCLMDHIAAIISEKVKEYGYTIETNLTNMTEMCLAFAESAAEEDPDMRDEYGITPEGIAAFIEEQGKIGLTEFDYYC